MIKAMLILVGTREGIYARMNLGRCGNAFMNNAREENLKYGTESIFRLKSFQQRQLLRWGLERGKEKAFPPF